jgi:hypothetical protein
MLTLVIGLLISFLSFLVAVKNMSSIASFDLKTFNVKSLIATHLGAMVGMSFGGIVTFLGIVMIIIDLVKGS